MKKIVFWIIGLLVLSSAINLLGSTHGYTPEFVISVSPTFQAVELGGRTAYTITVTSQGYSGSVSLEAIYSLGGGGVWFPKFRFNPSQVTLQPSGTAISILTVTVPHIADTGTWRVIITAKSGKEPAGRAFTDAKTVTLIVEAQTAFLWKAPLGSNPKSVQISDNLLFLEMANSIQVLNASTSKTIRSIDLTQIRQNTPQDWPILQATRDSKLYLASANYSSSIFLGTTVFALGTSGEVLWKRFFESLETSRVLPENSILLVQGVQNVPKQIYRLFALDSKDGSILWSVTDARVLASVKDRVVFGGNSFEIHVVNKANGQVVWTSDVGLKDKYKNRTDATIESIQVWGDTIYAKGSEPENYVVSLNLSDGKVNWIVGPMTGYGLQMFVSYGRLILLGTVSPFGNLGQPDVVTIIRDADTGTLLKSLALWQSEFDKPKEVFAPLGKMYTAKTPVVGARIFTEGSREAGLGDNRMVFGGIYAWNVLDGSLIWSYEHDPDMTRAYNKGENKLVLFAYERSSVFAVDEGKLVVGIGGKLYAFNTSAIRATGGSISVSPTSKMGNPILLNGSIPSSVPIELKILTRSPICNLEEDGVTTDKFGRFTYTIRPNMPGEWGVEVPWNGNEDFLPTRFLQTVKVEGTSEQIVNTHRQSFMWIRPTISFVTTLNEVVSISGDLYNSAGSTVESRLTLTLTRPNGSTILKTELVRSFPPIPFGFYEEFRPDQPGTWKVQAGWDGDEQYCGAKSNVLSFEVKPATTTATQKTTTTQSEPTQTASRIQVIFQTFSGTTYMTIILDKQSLQNAKNLVHVSNIIDKAFAEEEAHCGSIIEGIWNPNSTLTLEQKLLASILLPFDILKWKIWNTLNLWAAAQGSNASTSFVIKTYHSLPCP